MSGKRVKKGELTRPMQIAAVLEAQGQPRNVISQAIGLTGRRIGEFRNMPEYQAEVKRLEAFEVDETKNKIIDIRRNLLKGLDNAITTLVDMLNAEDDDGKPLYAVRLDASKALLGQGVSLILQPGESSNSSGQTVQATQIVVNVDTNDPKQLAAVEADFEELEAESHQGPS